MNMATQAFPLYEKPEAEYKPSLNEPYLSENYVATGAKTGSHTPTLGVESYTVTNPEVKGFQNVGKSDLIFDELIPKDLRETEPRMAKYMHTPHFHDQLCKLCANRMFDLNSIAFRPIPPTENQDDFNTDESCKCYYIELK